jgi:hypothetical protein
VIEIVPSFKKALLIYKRRKVQILEFVLIIQGLYKDYIRKRETIKAA